MPVEAREDEESTLPLGLPEQQRALLRHLLRPVWQGGLTLSRYPNPELSVGGVTFAESITRMTSEIDPLFDSRFVVILQEHLLDRRFVGNGRMLPRTQVGQIIILDGTTGDWRVEGLSTIRYVPIWALVRKHILITYEQFSTQGRAAAYCTSNELEEAYLHFGRKLFRSFGSDGFPPEEYWVTPKQINESLQYVKSKLGSPFAEAISVPTPYFVNAAPGNVYFCPTLPMLDGSSPSDSFRTSSE